MTRKEAYKGGQKLQTYIHIYIIGATLEVQTFHHPGSDHKGVLYRIRGNPGSAKVSTVKALPHRAFDLPEVVKFAFDRLAEFNASPTLGIECFGEWDVVKSKVKNFAQHTWEVRVKARGANRSEERRVGKECRP